MKNQSRAANPEGIYEKHQALVRNQRGHTAYHAIDLAFPITLTRQGKDKFTVTYGLEETSGLDYGTAARVLGEAMMHALQCDGMLDAR